MKIFYNPINFNLTLKYNSININDNKQFIESIHESGLSDTYKSNFNKTFDSLNKKLDELIKSSFENDIQQVFGGNYKEKYLKYKQKYLQLKKFLFNNKH